MVKKRMTNMNRGERYNMIGSSLCFNRVVSPITNNTTMEKMITRVIFRLFCNKWEYILIMRLIRYWFCTCSNSEYKSTVCQLASHFTIKYANSKGKMKLNKTFSIFMYKLIFELSFVPLMEVYDSPLCLAILTPVFLMFFAVTGTERWVLAGLEESCYSLHFDL